MACCGVKIQARRNGDLRITYTPSSRKFTFSGLVPTLTVRNGDVVLLTVTDSATANGSSFVVVGDSFVLNVTKEDIALLDSADPDTVSEILSYDVVATDISGFDNWLLGGLFIVLGLNDQSCGDSCGDVEVSLGGQCVDISIEGGNIGAGASVALEDLNAAVKQATDAAQDAESAATQAEAAAASIPGLIVNKADTDGGNVLAPNFRSSIETARIPTADKYGTQQAAANAAYANDLPFFGAVNSTIALTCSDGRLDLLCRKIGGWPIGDQGRINVTVPAGKYTLTAGQRVSFPFGQRVQIQGATPITLAFSSIVSVVSNATRDHDITISVTDGSSLSVGDVVIARAVTGTGWCGMFGGCWVVTAKPTANSFTFKHKAPVTAFGAYTVTGMTIKKMVSVLEFQGSSGLTLHGRLGDGSSGAQTGGLRDIVVIGNGAGSFNGIIADIGSDVVAQGELGVNGFGGDNIYGIYGSLIYAVFLCSSNSGGSGLYWLSGGAAQGVSGCFTGNNTFGAYAAYGSVLAFSNASCSGNLNGYGVLAASAAGNNMQIHGNSSGGIFATGGYMDVQGSSVISTGAFGVRATKGARINAASVTSQGHTTDLYADYTSIIENAGATATTLNPPQNTYGNSGSLILNSATAIPILQGPNIILTSGDPMIEFVDGATTAVASGDGGHLGIFASSVNRHPKLGYMNSGAYVDKFTFASGTSFDPVANNTVSVALTNNTTLTVKGRGGDGVLRSGTITLA